VLNAIIDQYLKPAEKINPLQVNVWGIVPYYDSLWINTLEQVEKTLRALGLEPNIIYGRGKGIAAIDKISAAAFNLVLAPWTDLDIAEKLKTVFGTPYLHYPCVPIGPTETTRFIRALTEYAGLDQIAAERYITEEDRYYFYIKNAIKNFSGGTQNPKGFYINSSAAMALSITRFLVNDWGFIPRKIFILDDVKPEYQENIIREFRDLEYDGKDDFDIVFTTDGGLCDQELNREDFEFNKVCVFGTAWDLLTAKNKQLPFVPVSAPYGDFPSMNKSYFAYDGALTFLRDLYLDMTNKILGSGVVARFETGGH
jgi:nitrogenase molybdenum-iron protein beta chain